VVPGKGLGGGVLAYIACNAGNKDFHFSIEVMMAAGSFKKVYSKFQVQCPD